MAGLLDFLIGNGLLQGGIGGPSSMNFGAGDQQIDPGLMAFAQSRAQPVPQPQGAQPQEQADIPQQPQPAQYQQPMPQQQPQNPYNRGVAPGTLITPLRAAMMAPAYQAQLQQAQYNSLGTMGYTPAERIAIMSDPNVALNMLGTHQLGSNKYPNGADIANVQVGRRIGQIATSDPRLNAMLGAPVKIGPTKIGPLEGNQVFGNDGQVQSILPGVGGAQGAPASSAQPGQPQPGTVSGLNGALNLAAEVQRKIESGTAQGKAEGGVAASLPNAQASMDQTISLIDKIATDPGLKNVVGGPLVGRNPGMTGAQNATIAKIEQLSGQMVTDAIQSMRGSGIRLTQNEINQLQHGAARLSRTQDLPAFKQALSELRGQMVGLRTRLGTMAGGEPTPPPNAQSGQQTQDQPPMEGARKAPDGHWYIQQGSKYFRVE